MTQKHKIVIGVLGGLAVSIIGVLTVLLFTIGSNNSVPPTSVVFITTTTSTTTTTTTTTIPTTTSTTTTTTTIPTTTSTTTTTTTIPTTTTTISDDCWRIIHFDFREVRDQITDFYVKRFTDRNRIPPRFGDVDFLESSNTCDEFEVAFLRYMISYFYQENWVCDDLREIFTFWQGRSQIKRMWEALMIHRGCDV